MGTPTSTTPTTSIPSTSRCWAAGGTTTAAARPSTRGTSELTAPWSPGSSPDILERRNERTTCLTRAPATARTSATTTTDECPTWAARTTSNTCSTNPSEDILMEMEMEDGAYR